MTIPRCQHVRVNGTQCGSPALRGKRHCYFHSRHQMKPARGSIFDFPTLEDANAIQIALMQVIHAIADGKIENKRAGLLLYALQTASYNLKRTTLEPGLTAVVRDTNSLVQEIAPPPDPVETLRQMRRTYWKMRDPDLIKQDQDIVSRECAAENAAPPPQPSLATRNPELATPDPLATRNSGLATSPGPSDEDERDALMNFVSQITHPPDGLATRNSELATPAPPATRDSGLATQSPATGIDINACADDNLAAGAPSPMLLSPTEVGFTCFPQTSHG